MELFTELDRTEACRITGGGQSGDPAEDFIWMLGMIAGKIAKAIYDLISSIGDREACYY